MLSYENDFWGGEKLVLVNLEKVKAPEGEVSTLPRCIGAIE